MSDELDTDDTDDLDLSDYSKGMRRLRQVIKILDPYFKERIQVWNGHFKNGEYFYQKGWYETPEKRLRSMFESMFTIIMTDEDFQRMETAKGAILDPPVVFGSRFSREFSCPYCSERLHLGFDGQRLIVVGSDPCPHPKGLTTEWDLNVPSGKIVVANDLRRWFPSPEDHNINALIGQHLTTLGYANVGMAHGYVGNSCPGVYRISDKFVIGSYRKEIWNDKTKEYDENPEPCSWGENVAGICTDLWWYSIVDADEFKRRLAHYTPGQKFIFEDEQVSIKQGRSKPRHYADVIDVKPGVYHFRHPCDTDHDSGTVEYATFEWVREPDPLVDYLHREKTMELLALDVLIEQCLTWPTLYMGLGYSAEDDKLKEDRPAMVKRWEGMNWESKISCLASAANHFMCVLGGGVKWHEKGFPRTVVSQEAKRLAEEFNTEGIVPAFQDYYNTSAPPKSFRRHWYPISEGYGGLCLGAGIRNTYSPDEPLIDLAPTFVLLGLNICQNAILYGEEPSLNHEVWPPTFEIPWCRERMKLFGRCYRGLREQHLNLVFDTSFDAWMQKVDFDQYVARFDFGPERPPEDKWGPPPVTVKTGVYFEFDARKLKEGHFCWHPKIMSAWANKKDAHRYAIHTLADTTSLLGHLHHEGADCGSCCIPFWVVGRVIRGTGEGYLSKELEVAFDYGTPDMVSKRWSIGESDMSALRQFDDKQEYEALLEKCKTFYTEVEAEVDALVAKKNLPPAPKPKKVKAKKAK